jgi:signal transduction histidine kinase
VRLELLEGLPPVRGDRVQLMQVLVNLMTNGADAMRRVPRELRQLVVRTRADRGAITVSVQDAGAGIDPQNARHLFEPFFTTKPGGMGMGLAICKLIVEAHGGRIWASPQGEGGSTFEFTLPAAEGET